MMTGLPTTMQHLMLISKNIKWTPKHQCKGCGDHAIKEEDTYCKTCQKWIDEVKKHENNKRGLRG